MSSVSILGGACIAVVVVYCLLMVYVMQAPKEKQEARRTVAGWIFKAGCVVILVIYVYFLLTGGITFLK